MKASKIKNIWLRRLYLVTVVPVVLLYILALLYGLLFPLLFVLRLIHGVGLGFQLFWKDVEEMNPSQIYRKLPANYKKAWYNEQSETQEGKQ